LTGSTNQAKTRPGQMSKLNHNRHSVLFWPDRQGTLEARIDS
jgi:hypothetical protein